MKNNNEQQSAMSRTQRYEQQNGGSKRPQQATGFTKQKRTHGFLSFLMGLIFILALVVRLTVLNGGFMENAIQTPTVINRVHAELASELQKKNLPTSLATDSLIKATLKTGTEETYAGDSLNFNTSSIRSAVQSDVNEQASSLGLVSNQATDAVTTAISGQILNEVSQNYHNDTIESFSENIHSYQLWADIILVVSGLLWLLLLISNHHRRRLRRLSRK